MLWIIEIMRKYKNGITFEDLNKEWLDDELNGCCELPRSTFNDHLRDIHHIFKISIGCGKGKNLYKITNDGREGRFQQWMLGSMARNAMLSRYSTLSNRILLEPMPEVDYLDVIMKAMTNNRHIMFTFKDTEYNASGELIAAPLCLKTYHNRWYLAVMLHNDISNIKVFCLDQRIQGVEMADSKFKLPANFDAEDIFEEYFGVRINHPNDPDHAERIVLRAYKDQRYKWLYQPLHHSQKLHDKLGEDYADFEYHMRITYDFVSYLESLGRYVEVLEPRWLREELVRVHTDAIERNKIS